MVGLEEENQLGDHWCLPCGDDDNFDYSSSSGGREKRTESTYI